MLTQHMLNPLSIFSVTALDLAHIYPSDHSLRGASSVFLPAGDQHLKISSCLDFLVGSHQNNPPNQAVYSITTIITCPWNDMHLHEILTQQGLSHLEILPITFSVMNISKCSRFSNLTDNDLVLLR